MCQSAAKSLLAVKATFPLNSDSSILTTILLIVESVTSRITTFLQNLVVGTPLPIASAFVELATNSATRAPTLVVFASGSTFQIRINLN